MVSVFASAAIRWNDPAPNLVRDNHHRCLALPNRLAEPLHMGSNGASPTALSSHDVGQIQGQTINHQQVSCGALLDQGAVETLGDLNRPPRRGPLPLVFRYPASHLGIIRLCRGNEDDAWGGRSKFLRVATFPAPRSTKHERHRLRQTRWHVPER